MKRTVATVLQGSGVVAAVFAGWDVARPLGLAVLASGLLAFGVAVERD
jgi:hypothetical protein